MVYLCKRLLVGRIYHNSFDLLLPLRLLVGGIYRNSFDFILPNILRSLRDDVNVTLYFTLILSEVWFLIYTTFGCYFHSQYSIYSCGLPQLRLQESVFLGICLACFCNKPHKYPLCQSFVNSNFS